MSSTRQGGPHGGATATQYFCYQCNHTISIPSPSPDPICPTCNSGFIEELDSPNPINIPSLSSPFDHLFSAATSSPSDLSSLFSTSSSPDEFNPFSFLQNYLSTLRHGGAQIQLIIENSDGTRAGGGVGVGGGGFSLPANLGDYFVGPGLEQLIQQLAENDPNRYGTPPASKTAVEGLPDVIIDEEIMGSDYSQCAVCMDDFGIGDLAKQMPCKHMYHEGCIIPWLELHNSCPVCRFELPTDDLEYERRGEREEGSGDVAVAVGEEGVLTPRSVERRFRVTLPWPFRGFGGEGSGGTGGSGSGGQAREEDLD